MRRVLHTTESCGAQIAIPLLQLPRNRDDVRDHPGPVHVIHKGVGRRRCIYPMLLQLHPIAGRDLHNCTADGLQQIRVEQCLRVNAKRFNVRDLVSLTLRSRSFHAPEIVRKQNTRFTSATQFAQYRKSIEEAKAVPAWRESASQEWRRDLALYIFEESCSWQTRQISSNREAQLGKSWRGSSGSRTPSSGHSGVH